jgi:Uri superfamily endonuclease
VIVRQRRPTGLTRPRTYRLPAGEYLYVGSAFGPGGLAARVGRHLAPGSHPLHWDVDFLLAALARHATFEAWGRITGDRATECRWAAALARRAGTSPVVGVRAGGGPSGFGAGDCRRRCGCAPGAPDAARTHLFRLAGRVTRTGVGRSLGVALAALGRSAPRLGARAVVTARRG